MLNVINPYTFDSAILPHRVDVTAWSSVDGSGGVTYARAQNSNYLSGGAATHVTAGDADDGDWVEWDVLVDSGTYTVTMVYGSAPNRGIHDVKVDGTSLGTVDGYTAGTIRNNVASFTGVALAAGHHTIRVAINGKNASSSDYLLDVQVITLTRTGA